MGNSQCLGLKDGRQVWFSHFSFVHILNLMPPAGTTRLLKKIHVTAFNLND